MKQTVAVGALTFGQGLPKICVPIVAKTESDLRSQASAIRALPADLVEWRGDWYSTIFDPSARQRAFAILREELGEMPILFTFRTHREGGVCPAEMSDYLSLTRAVAESGMVDVVDVELSCGDDHVRSLIACAHAHNVKVIVSNHDFHATPDEEELVRRLTKMEELGADLPKLAVMPQTPADVRTLLAATARRHTEGTQPIITMSMSQMGMLSRVAGQLYGSCMTFGSADCASAPGQIPAAELKQLLEKFRL